MKLTRLVALAKDLNKCLVEEDSAIDLEQGKKSLLAQIKANADEIEKSELKARELDNDDEPNLSDESWDALAELGYGEVKEDENGSEENDGDGDENADNEGEEKVAEKKTAAKKIAAKKPAKKTAATKKDKAPSNKAVVYTAWKKGKGETDPAKLFKLVKKAVKEATIASWLNQ